MEKVEEVACNQPKTCLPAKLRHTATLFLAFEKPWLKGSTCEKGPVFFASSSSAEPTTRAEKGRVKEKTAAPALSKLHILYNRCKFQAPTFPPSPPLGKQQLWGWW